MSRAQVRELVMLFAIGSALTLAVFALWLLPFERLPPAKILALADEVIE